jgi:hypothetical protein
MDIKRIEDIINDFRCGLITPFEAEAQIIAEATKPTRWVCSNGVTRWKDLPEPDQEEVYPEDKYL